MKIIDTSKDLSDLTPQESEWVYNGLDACVTHEVDQKTEAFVTPEVQFHYDFIKRQLRPILAMMLRGIAVDEIERQSMINEKAKDLFEAETWLNEMGTAVGFGDINPRSPAQLKDLFFSHMKMTPIELSFKGEKKVTTNREALEKLYATEFYSRPFVQAIFSARDLSKILSVLRTKVFDGRFRTTFNPAGTGTGRWSSTESPFGTGSNIQNITYELRRIFIADPGKVLAYADLEQAESRAVAYYAQDLRYIEACESGDLHTYCARLFWPKLPWTGDLKKDREVAETHFYRHFTHRDMSKRGGHASNYYATAWTVARNLKIQQSVVDEFQTTYFGTFNQIPIWWREVAETLHNTRTLTTAMGMRRIFFGRVNDDSELRKAIAFLPQSTVAWILNTGLCQVWEKLDPWVVELLAQIHDALLYQVDEDKHEVYKDVENLMKIPVKIHGRVMTIPVETKMGYNWRDLVKASAFVPHNRPKRSLLEMRL